MATKKKVAAKNVEQDFTIFKGQDVPVSNRAGMKYPFGEMKEVGDAFFVALNAENAKADLDKEVKRVKGSVNGAARRYREKFKTGTEPRFVIGQTEHPKLKVACVGCWLAETAKKVEVVVPVADESAVDEGEDQ
jgi:hypothetical protein